MNKKSLTKATKLWKGAALSGVALLLFQAPLLAADQEKVPETIDINIQATCPDLPELGKDVKEVKGFKHAAHAEYAKGNQEFAGHPYPDNFSCAACHAGAGNEDELVARPACERLAATLAANGGGKNYKKFIHGLCQDCHKKMKAADKTGGPTSCKECHGR